MTMNLPKPSATIPAPVPQITLRQWYAGLVMTSIVSRAPVALGDVDRIADVSVTLADMVITRLGR